MTPVDMTKWMEKVDGGHEFEGKQGRVYGRISSKERQERNAVTIL